MAETFGNGGARAGSDAAFFDVSGSGCLARAVPSGCIWPHVCSSDLQIEKNRRGHNRNFRQAGAGWNADALLLEETHHARSCVEPERGAAAQQDGVRSPDQAAGPQQVSLACARGRAAHVNADGHGPFAEHHAAASGRRQVCPVADTNARYRGDPGRHVVRLASGAMRPLRLVVIGGLNMDLVVRVPQLPRPGETVTGEDLLRAAGGKGANQAVAAARLGASVTLVGRVGYDAFGRDLKRSLRDAHVNTRWVLGCQRPTGAALIFVDEAGQNSIAVAPGANNELLPDEIPARVVERADVVVAPLEVPLASIDEAFRLARHAGVRTVLNAAPAQAVAPALLRHADVVICNEVELATLVGGSVAASREAEAARELRAFADQVVIVTLGERGALAVCPEGVLQQPAFEVGVVDTTGAGDAFVAGFVVGRWFEAGVAEALRFGCAGGGLATTRRGAQPSMPPL